MAKRARQQRRAEQKRLLGAATSNPIFRVGSIRIIRQDPSPVIGTAWIPDWGGELDPKTPRCAPCMQESAPPFV